MKIKANVDLLCTVGVRYAIVLDRRMFGDIADIEVKHDQTRSAMKSKGNSWDFRKNGEAGGGTNGDTVDTALLN